MSLKNTYGFSGSLLDAVSSVLKEEKCLCDCGKSPCEKCGKDHHEMDEGYVSHAQRKAVWASRNDEKKNKIKEEVTLDEKHTVSHEKSRSGGYRAKLMDKDGKISYLGSTSYHDPKHAEGEAKAYIDNWKSDRAVIAYRSKAKEAGHVKEEVEDLDELSKSTLSSYAKKAVDDVSYHSSRGGARFRFSAGGKESKDPTSLRHDKIATKRQAGVEKAINRLTKEEVEDLDELKTSTIKSYTKKAVSSSMTGQGGEKRVQGIGRAMDKLSARKKEEGERGRFIPKFGKAANEQVESEDAELLDELKTSTIKSYTKKAVSSSMSGEGGEKRVQGIGRAMDKLSARKKEEGERGRYIPSFKKASNEEVELQDEVINERIQDKTYPYQANQAATSMVTLVAMLRYLKATGMLQKLMKEDIELAGVFFGEEVRDEMYDFMEANKSAFMIMHKPEPKKSDPDSDEHEDAYKPASGKDQPHVMNQLAGAADAGGRHIDTAKGKRYVSGSTAKKLHGALMRAKPEERAKLSSNLYKNSHSAIEKDHADAVKRGVKPPAEKKGRGRPKKVQ